MKAPFRIIFGDIEKRVFQGCSVKAGEVVFDDIGDICKGMVLVNTKARERNHSTTYP
jgi:hypothetical protein